MCAFMCGFVVVATLSVLKTQDCVKDSMYKTLHLQDLMCVCTCIHLFKQTRFCETARLFTALCVCVSV